MRTADTSIIDFISKGNASGPNKQTEMSSEFEHLKWSQGHLWLFQPLHLSVAGKPLPL